MNILTNVDLHGGQVLNVAIQNLSQAPAEKTLGQIYYNTQDKRIYCWTGENWLPLDAKDASPTAVSIVRTINDGTSLINIDKVKDLATKLGADSLVQTINDGSANINADRIQGLSTAISGESIVSKINEGEDRKSTRLNSSHANISYAVFCLTKKLLYLPVLIEIRCHTT